MLYIEQAAHRFKLHSKGCKTCSSAEALCQEGKELMQRVLAYLSDPHQTVKVMMHTITDKMQTVVSAIEYQYWDVAKTGCREIEEIADVLSEEVRQLEQRGTRKHYANHQRKTRSSIN